MAKRRSRPRSASRLHAEALYGHRYQRFYHDVLNRYCCFYCGQPADTMDHVPPLTRVSDYEAFGLANPRYLTVPSCPECNSLAGDTLQESILDRAVFIHRALESKYRKTLKSANWSEAEIRQAGLSGRLKWYIKGNSRVVSRLLDRLDYVLGVQVYVNAFDPIDFPDRRGAHE